MDSLRSTQPMGNSLAGAIAAAMQAALQMLEGRGMAPTPEVAAVFGVPASHEALCRWRRERRLPFKETLFGGRYYVTAADLAEALLPESAKSKPEVIAQPEQAAQKNKRRRGRPRNGATAMLEGSRQMGGRHHG